MSINVVFAHKRDLNQHETRILSHKCNITKILPCLYPKIDSLVFSGSLSRESSNASWSATFQCISGAWAYLYPMNSNHLFTMEFSSMHTTSPTNSSRVFLVT